MGIMDLLYKHPNGLKARQIATYFSVDRKLINQILYSNTNDFVINEAYVWKINSQKSNRISFEKNQKESILNELREKYKLGYIERTELAKLDYESFQNAVKHAKLMYKNKNLPFMTSDNWIKTVTLDEFKFNIEIKRLEEVQKERIEARRINREKRNQEINEICILCEKHNISEETKAKLVASGKTYAEISLLYSLCREHDITEYSFLKLINSNVTYNELQKKIEEIRYYKKIYPEINISLSTHVLSTKKEFNDYINTAVSKKEFANKCFGDCSSCKREYCIMDKH